ncbi:MAG: bifunctional precorrin-2 dehydrogenase/sirohydrochlorin ferrochelatase [Deltaproteobacteria bacterium]|jgi:precorrin-2 dehydrogenase/sirohydrochlorin ferrochelatase|nr:bifunctional precorrin-2 dehydrogenase/sirohydrochlorin ferrochelatase [Deltaproteobacteria bacterium]
MLSLAANLLLHDRSALLVGAGAVGGRKLSYLLATGVDLSVVEPRPEPWLLELERSGKLAIHESFSESLLDKSPLVFIASPEVEESMVSAIKERGLWLNVAGEPALGNFTLPALVEDGDFRLTVSTGGASPALSAKVAAHLREEFKGYGELCRILKLLREKILTSNLEAMVRRRIFLSLATESDTLAGFLREGKREEALKLLNQLIAPLKLPEDISWERGEE